MPSYTNPQFATSDTTKLYANGLSVELLNSPAMKQKLARAYQAYAATSKRRSWTSPTRPMNSNLGEVFEVVLQDALRINEIEFQLAHFPQTFNVEYFDLGSKTWKSAMGDPIRKAISGVIRDSIPAVIKPEINGPDLSRPQNYGAGHWKHYKFKISPIKTNKIRIKFWRGPGNGPKSVSGTSLSYSLGVKDFNLGYVIQEKKDVPRLPPQPTKPTEKLPFVQTKDITGSSVEFAVTENKASDLLQGKIWKSGAQPTSDAVVNLYVDARDSAGKPQIVDRFFIEPLTSGPHLNIYYSDETPDGDFSAGETLMGSPDVSVSESNKTFVTASPDGIKFTDNGQLVIDNKTPQVNLNKPFTFYIKLQMLFDSDDNFWDTWTTNIASVISVGDMDLRWYIDPDDNTSRGFLLTTRGDKNIFFPVGFNTGDILDFIVSGDSENISFRLDNREKTIGANPQPFTKFTLGGSYASTSIDHWILKTMVFREDMPTDALVESFAKDGSLFVCGEEYESNDTGTTKNANLRFHPTFITTGEISPSPFGFVGGRGSQYENLVWSPIDRDFSLHRGTLEFDPVKANFFKFEFTGLVAEPFEVLESVIAKTKFFPPVIKKPTPKIFASNTESGHKGDIGLVVAQQNASALNYSDAYRIFYNAPGGGPTQVYAPTEVLYAADARISANLRQIAGYFNFAPWLPATRQRFSEKGKHKYEEIDINFQRRVAYFVGLRSLEMFRVDYIAGDDTAKYVDHFNDDAFIDLGKNALDQWDRWNFGESTTGSFYRALSSNSRFMLENAGIVETIYDNASPISGTTGPYIKIAGENSALSLNDGNGANLIDTYSENYDGLSWDAYYRLENLPSTSMPCLISGAYYVPSGIGVTTDGKFALWESGVKVEETASIISAGEWFRVSVQINPIDSYWENAQIFLGSNINGTIADFTLTERAAGGGYIVIGNQSLLSAETDSGSVIYVDNIAAGKYIDGSPIRAQLREGGNWTLADGVLRTPSSSSTDQIWTTESKVLNSHSRVTGVQFATVQDQAVQILSDPDFFKGPDQQAPLNIWPLNTTSGNFVSTLSDVGELRLAPQTGRPVYKSTSPSPAIGAGYLSLPTSSSTQNTTFSTNTGSGFNGSVRSIAVQSDEKIIVGGTFTSLNSGSNNRIARLSSAGVPDSTFAVNVGTGFSNYVLSVVVQSDDKILAGGKFATLNGVDSKRVGRLDADGTPDTTFSTNMGTGFNDDVNALAIQSDGKIVVGGSFTTVNGVSSPGIARLGSDGTPDTAFTVNIGIGFNAAVNALAIQENGKIVVGGIFTTLNGAANTFMARLNEDGTPDTTFTDNLISNGDAAGIAGLGVDAVALQSSGGIILGGSIDSINGVTSNKIVRLNSDGSPDLDFSVNIGTGFGTYGVNSLAIQSNDKIVVGGEFVTLNGVGNKYLARLDLDGTPDVAFNTDIISTGNHNGVGGTLKAVALQSGDITVFGGNFTDINGATSNYVAALNIGENASLSLRTIDDQLMLDQMGFSWDAYYYLADLPTTSTANLIAGTYLETSGLGVTTDGALALFDAGAIVGQTEPGTVPTDQWFRISVRVDPDTNQWVDPYLYVGANIGGRFPDYIIEATAGAQGYVTIGNGFAGNSGVALYIDNPVVSRLYKDAGNWSSYGDAIVTQAENVSSVIGNALRVHRKYSSSSWEGIEFRLNHWSDIGTLPWDQIEVDSNNGINAGGVINQEKIKLPDGQRIYAAARIYAPDVLTEPVAVQVVHSTSQVVVGEAYIPEGSQGIIEWFAPYTTGSAMFNFDQATTEWAASTAYAASDPQDVVTYLGDIYACISNHTSDATFEEKYWLKVATHNSWTAIQLESNDWNGVEAQIDWTGVENSDVAFSNELQVRIIQGGPSNDIFYVDNLSVFVERIEWEFSNDGGNTYFPALGIRNNPNGVLLFPSADEYATQLTWRLRGYGPGLTVSGINIRPLYDVLPAGVPHRESFQSRGPNISFYDQDPPISQDPWFKLWDRVIPEDWWLSNRKNAIR